MRPHGRCSDARLIRTVAETGSTNDDVAALAARRRAEGPVAARRAPDRRAGPAGPGWESPPGNLYASTLVRLRPGDPPAPTLALVAAVALHEVAAALCRRRRDRDQMAQRPAGRRRQARRHPARAAAAMRWSIGFGVNLAASSRRSRSAGDQPRGARRRGARSRRSSLEMLADELRALARRAGGARGSRRSATAGSRARIRSARRSSPRGRTATRSTGCSTASTRRRAAPALGGRHAAVSSTPATCS